MLNFETLLNRIITYFEQHEEQAFIVKAAILIALIFSSRQFLIEISSRLFLLFIFAPVIYWLILRSALTGQDRSSTRAFLSNITFLPVPITEQEWKTDGIAWTTYILLLINIATFYLLQPGNTETIHANFIFFPQQPTPLNISLSTITTMFLHSNQAHLWSNMMFLWAFGTVIEKRLGWKKFSSLYLTTGVASALFAAIIHSNFIGGNYHGLGASGAISGIMGLYAVRCYFKTMLLPLPLLGLLSIIFPIYLKVRVNALVLIGLFFVIDTNNGINQLATASLSNINDWAHVGGMITGILLGLILKLTKPAIAEKHTQLSKQHRPEGGFGLDDKKRSLEKVLQLEPHNLEAMLEIVRIDTTQNIDANAEQRYLAIIKAYLAVDQHKAAEIFREYFNKSFRSIEPQLQYRLAAILWKMGDLPTATRALDMLVDDQTLPSLIREKSMFQIGKLLDEMGMPNDAREYFKRFIEVFPDSVLVDKAKKRIEFTT